MPKPRKYATLEHAEIIVRLTPAQVRDHLLLLADCALWNSTHSEDDGSPEQRCQETFARELKRCAQVIEKECREHYEK